MKVAVIGGGAAGLMAAYAAAVNGNEVTVYEKNNKCGKKIYITGKGRCNFTNAVPPEEFLRNVVRNSKFLTGAIYSFAPERTIQFFEDGGVPVKVERGNRAFPQSDKASDITKCLEIYCKNAGVRICLDDEVQDFTFLNSTVSDIITSDGSHSVDKIIVCTGGLSYPTTGSTGDGYKFARKAGHKIVEPRQALCGVNLAGSYFKSLQGLTLKNVRLTAEYAGKVVFDNMGEMLFTHFGASGPLILSLSSLINRLDLKGVKLRLDLKPALDDAMLDKRILRDFAEFSNKSIYNCLKNLLPVSLIDVVLQRAGIAVDKKVNVITRAERAALLTNIKNFDMIVTSLRGYEEAIITSGGVDVKDINPKTMESKLVKGLYFCGEVLDVDAFTGGYNLQIAFATGYAAGNSIKD
ncbi:MAG TPA: NAD(P)/FAD-dependent oxidoreductase [Candidatus Coproplasma excrementipullorum]|nr:NAD(P)/FAD-dependent oxidoreductase [Candidatus Coproplasma excrementipullorum]